jgi:hypothetical protein
MFSFQYFRSLVNDKIGGDFFLYLPVAKGYATVVINGTRGNPTIQFDSEIPNIVINLDPSDVAPHDSKYFAKESVKLQEIQLTKDLSNENCSSIHEPGNPINPVFAFYDNSYWIHDPRFVSRKHISLHLLHLLLTNLISHHLFLSKNSIP